MHCTVVIGLVYIISLPIYILYQSKIQSQKHTRFVLWFDFKYRLQYIYLYQSQHSMLAFIMMNEMTSTFSMTEPDRVNTTAYLPRYTPVPNTATHELPTIKNQESKSDSTCIILLLTMISAVSIAAIVGTFFWIKKLPAAIELDQMQATLSWIQFIFVQDDNNLLKEFLNLLLIPLIYI